jgi:hypothetical protein
MTFPTVFVLFVLSLSSSCLSQPQDAPIDKLLGQGGTGAAEAARASGGVVMEGDMLLTQQQHRLHYSETSPFAGAGVRPSETWPQGVIAYHFPWTMAGREKNIFAAMEEWSSKTCIRFTRRNSALHRSVGHGHYIIIKDAGGCFSRQVPRSSRPC